MDPPIWDGSLVGELHDGAGSPLDGADRSTRQLLGLLQLVAHLVQGVADLLNRVVHAVCALAQDPLSELQFLDQHLVQPQSLHRSDVPFQGARPGIEPLSNKSQVVVPLRPAVAHPAVQEVESPPETGAGFFSGMGKTSWALLEMLSL